jgi:hypothetical protein
MREYRPWGAIRSSGSYQVQFDVPIVGFGAQQFAGHIEAKLDPLRKPVWTGGRLDLFGLANIQPRQQLRVHLARGEAKKVSRLEKN